MKVLRVTQYIKEIDFWIWH